MVTMLYEKIPPKASPMHCKPMHTPNNGTIGPSSKTVSNDIPESRGSPMSTKILMSILFFLSLHWALNSS